jgi:excinuclease ABC subunit C
MIQQLCLFLEGRHEQILKQMRQKMEAAAQELQFERAAFLRDQVAAVEKVTERQRVISTAMMDEDVIAFARSNGEACVQVFLIRGGKLVGREHFALEGTHDEESKEIMTSFVTQFYDGATYVPPRILLQNEVDEAKTIEAWLREKRGDKVSIRVPRRGENKKLMEMVAENAAEVLAEMRARWLADEVKTGNALLELAEQLDLAAPPRRIECYDISNIRGTAAVGSMAVFVNGQAKSSEYRRFQIRTVAGIDDYAMMQEVLRRRFKRVAAADSADESGSSWSSWRIIPDLVVIDGGKGHLSAAMAVLRELDLEGRVPAISLAKQNEEVFTPEHAEALVLPRTSQGLYLLQRIRDEAHRFAITYHKTVRAKRTFASRIDDIAGIGPKRKAALLKHFGSLKEVGQASLEEIAAAASMPADLARRVKEMLE